MIEKRVFNVGKTYLTRDGLVASIISSNGNTLEGNTTDQEGIRRHNLWYLTGTCVFSGQPGMHLVHPDEKQEIKKTFEVGKTYLTRDGRKVLIKSHAGTTIIATIRYENVTEHDSTWYATGNYFFSGQSPMDLMPLDEENNSNGGYLEKENANLFKQNLELLAEVDALQKENGRLYVELQETRMIARGMVDIAKSGKIYKIL